MQESDIPPDPTWPWIVGLIIAALLAVVAAVKKLWSRNNASQDSLVQVLRDDLERRDKADTRRDDEMKSIIASHEKIVDSHEKVAESSKRLVTSLADNIKKAIDDQGKRHEKVLNRIVDRLDRDREPPRRDS